MAVQACFCWSTSLTCFRLAYGWVDSQPSCSSCTDASPRTAAAAARWFSPIGKWCVFGIILSAGFQSWSLIGSVPGLVGTAYGWLALAKLALFAVLLGFAVANRYRLAPALLTPDPACARRALVLSVAIQTGFGLLTVLAAATLASLPPAIHEQPIWPFSVRPSLVAIEDHDLRQEVALAVLGVAAAIAIALVGFAWKRVRWPSWILSIVLGLLATPHLDLLFVEAYPTSFYRSPTGFAPASIVHGTELFASNCVTCHGVEGRGDGSLARALTIPPADLTAPHLWDHSDGELFWWLSQGMLAPEGGAAMPGFADRLSKSDRWDLIDAVRAHNAGVAMRETGTWSHPVPAPEFSAICAGERQVDLAELRGRVVRLILGGGDEAPTPPPPSSQTGIEIVDVYVLAASDPKGAGCVAPRLGPTAFTGHPDRHTREQSHRRAIPDRPGGVATRALAPRSTWRMGRHDLLLPRFRRSARTPSNSAE